MLDKLMLDVLVCPHCKGKLTYQEQAQQLVCESEGLSYPIEDGIPVLLVDRARQLTPDE